MKIDFNPNEHDPEAAIEIAPPGWYQTFIDQVEVSESQSAAAGQMVTVRVEVDPDVHPEWRGKKCSINLCIYHENKTPREIAQRQLSSICHAVNVLPETLETEELLGCYLMTKLKVSKAREVNGVHYDPRNEIAGFAAVGDKKPVSAPPKEPEGRSKRQPTRVVEDKASDDKPDDNPKGRKAPAWS